jgi:hypothetical protein
MKTYRIALAAAAAFAVLGASPAGAVSGARQFVSIQSSFSPSALTILYQVPNTPASGQVEWDFNNNPSILPDMSATDSTGLNLFNSGPHHSPHAFTYTFKWAGSFPYHSTTNGAKGVIHALMQRSPAAGGLGTTFTLHWASVGRTNCVFDVEVKRPGTTKWAYLKFGTTALTATYKPAKRGWYGVRSRIRNTASKKFSLFSPVTLIHVT